MSFIFLGFNPEILLHVRSAEVVGPVPLVDFKYAGKFSSLHNWELWLFRDPTTATESRCQRVLQLFCFEVETKF